MKLGCVDSELAPMGIARLLEAKTTAHAHNDIPRAQTCGANLAP